MTGEVSALISVKLSGFLKVSNKAIRSYYQSSSFTLLCGSVTVSGKDHQPCGGKSPGEPGVPSAARKEDASH